MNCVDWIKIKQQNWAKRKVVVLDMQNPFYTNELGGNLFLQKLTLETEIDFQAADGGELFSKDGIPAKMQALHSSSALAVSVFDYWSQDSKNLLPIMVSCNLVSNTNKTQYGMQFERKFSILGTNSHPANVDVVFSEKGDNGNVFILESKFSEPYRKKNKKMKRKYFEDETIWRQIQNLRKEADSIAEYSYLDAGQLIKHLLGALNERK